MIALVTCRSSIDADTDLPLLQRELPDAVVTDWADEQVDWSAFEVVVIRSTWDYHRHLEAYLAWANAVSRVSRLWNPIDLIEWNIDKRYLDELARSGLPTVPTTFLPDVPAVDEAARQGVFDGHCVTKPSVGASATGVLLTRDDPVAAADHARALVQEDRIPMVQPYQREIETSGETGLIYVGGRFSHGLRRRVVLPPPGQDPGVVGDETSVPRRPSASERELGDAVVAWLPETAYARVDLLPGPDGPVVLEVEVNEPSLFLHLDERAPARAAAVFRNL